MRDFWYTFLGFTFVGIFLAGFIRFVFFLAMYSYTEKALGIIALYAVLGLIFGAIAQYYKVVTYVIDKLK
jgi:hypothetical protein